jgi:hypothetical protein
MTLRKWKIEECMNGMPDSTKVAYLLNVLTDRRYAGKTPEEIFDAEYMAMIECLADRSVDEVCG